MNRPYNVEQTSILHLESLHKLEAYATVNHKLEAYATGSLCHKKRQGLVKRPCLFSFQETEVTRNSSLLPLEFDTESDGSCRSISISSKYLHEVGRSYTQVRVSEVRCIGYVEGLSAELA